MEFIFSLHACVSGQTYGTIISEPVQKLNVVNGADPVWKMQKLPAVGHFQITEIKDIQSIALYANGKQIWHLNSYLVII